MLSTGTLPIVEPGVGGDVPRLVDVQRLQIITLVELVKGGVKSGIYQIYHPILT